jgi:large subunit ribosomal protein L28
MMAAPISPRAAASRVFTTPARQTLLAKSDRALFLALQSADAATGLGLLPRLNGGVNSLWFWPSFPLLRLTSALYSRPFNQLEIMARICAITGKRPVKGNSINRKGQSKKSGGIGTHVTSITKRKFRPNLQRIRVKLPNGGTKRLLVSVKAIKAGLVQKA